jgi:pentatricopeptide repeat protein
LDLLENDIIVGSALVDMYAKLGFLERAEDVFDQISSRDTTVWNVLISGYADHDYGREVLNCFEKMKLEGVPPDAVTFVVCLKACGIIGAIAKGLEIHSEICRKGILGDDIVVTNALVGMYAKCGLMSKAQEVFDRLPVQDVVTWSTLISGYGHLGEIESVFRNFEKMRIEGRKPDFITFVSVLNACSQSLLIEEGRSLFESIKEDDDATVPTIEHHACMVGLLGQAGHIESALEMVKDMPLHPDIGIWHCLLDACTKWGSSELGKITFGKAMQLDDKDAVSYLRLSRVYSDAGFVKMRY